MLLLGDLLHILLLLRLTAIILHVLGELLLIWLHLDNILKKGLLHRFKISKNILHLVLVLLMMDSSHGARSLRHLLLLLLEEHLILLLHHRLVHRLVHRLSMRLSTTSNHRHISSLKGIIVGHDWLIHDN